MPTETARQFLRTVEQDESLAKRLCEAGTAEDFFAKVIEEAQRLGIPLTDDDLKSVLEEVSATNQELSDEQLESVAGGAMYQDFRNKFGLLSQKIVKGGVANGTANCTVTCQVTAGAGGQIAGR